MKRYLYRSIILLIVSSLFICCDKIDDGKIIVLESQAPYGTPEEEVQTVTVSEPYTSELDNNYGGS